MDTQSRSPSDDLIRHLRAAACNDESLRPFVYLCDQALARRGWAIDRIAAVFVEDDMRRPSAYMRLLAKGVARADIRVGVECVDATPRDSGGYRRVIVCKADPAIASDVALPGRVIEVTGRIGATFDPESDAEAIAAALWEALPGATCDRLLEAMLRRRASQLHVPRSTMDSRSST